MSPRSIEALVFDFDGLIQDSETVGFQSWVEICAEHGHQFPLSDWAGYIGTDANPFDFLKLLTEKLGLPLDREEVVQRWAQRAVELIEEKPALPGVESYLADARQLNLRLGIASSAPRDWVEGNLKRLDLHQYFECLKCKGEAARAKPHPDLYQAVLQNLEVQPSQAIAFEDSPNGIRAAKRAGIFCVAVPNQITAQLSVDHADLVLSSLADLPLADLLETIVLRRG